MWAEKRDGDKVLAAMPSLGDMSNLGDSESAAVGERIGITQPDAKIELRHLSAIEPSSTRNGTRAQLFENGDLIIFLSEQDFRNWPQDGVSIERASVETPLIEDKQFRTGLLETAIPEGGVLVDFSQMMSPRSHPHG